MAIPQRLFIQIVVRTTSSLPALGRVRTSARVAIARPNSATTQCVARVSHTENVNIDQSLAAKSGKRSLITSTVSPIERGTSDAARHEEKSAVLRLPRRCRAELRHSDGVPADRRYPHREAVRLRSAGTRRGWRKRGERAGARHTREPLCVRSTMSRCRDRRGCCRRHPRYESQAVDQLPAERGLLTCRLYPADVEDRRQGRLSDRSADLRVHRE